ncbi:S8 family serine peptidase [Aquabacterium sp.]|uniref:S8 family serine peptidase n=1 Tax=Aquabacterium sp. TaxID=1872578 RepID=UPI0019BD7532|nr:S8 family serine peptidase [Aquabacterium sp.]MBC7700983.1 S8 family serine peptidase [Aquabacterium sp.]
MLVFSAAAVAAENQPASPRMAMGLIVKLKDAQPQSVVRLKASSVPSDGKPRQRQRLGDAARRKRVSYIVSRETAFGATVIHPGHAISLQEAKDQAERLRADPDVEWVVVNEIVRKQAVYIPSGPLPSTASQSWLRPISATTQPGFANIEPAWAKLTDGRALTPVVVAILDTGILSDPALSGRYMAGYDFIYSAVLASDEDGIDPDATDMGDGITTQDISNYPGVFNGSSEGCSNVASRNSWHGLEIAGVLGGNLDGMAGVLAPLRGETSSAVILPVRVAGKCGAEVSSIIEGMLWSANVPYQGAPSTTVNPHPAARVINLSFGGEGVCSLSNVPRDAGWLYANTIATLKSQGVLVVASAGNGDDAVGYAAASLPANCAGVLSATGLDMRGYKAGYANLTSQGIAVASGDLKSDRSFADDGILTTSYDDSVTTPFFDMRAVAGTSFAAPQAAGVVAMMLAVNPSLSVDQLLLGIEMSARPHVISANLSGVSSLDQPQGVCSSTNKSHCYCTTTTCGAGILDAAQAVDWAIARQGMGTFTGPATSYTSPNVYFTPDRTVSTTAPSGGGGGGSLDWRELFGLASLTSLAAFKRRRPNQSRQAAKLFP